MASGSDSESPGASAEIPPRVALVPPPRLPFPPGYRQQPMTTDHGVSEVATTSLGATIVDSRRLPDSLNSSFSRHRRLPPIDTSQASHQQFWVHQSNVGEGQLRPVKRQRTGTLGGGLTPPLVSHPETGADSSSIRPHADVRHKPSEAQLHQSTQRFPAASADPQLSGAWESHAEVSRHDALCCSPGCQGSSCSRLRIIVQELVTEICSRDPHVSGAATTSDFLPPKPILPEATEIDTADALEWALQRLRWNNASLKTLLATKRGHREVPEPSSPPNVEAESVVGVQDRMKRHHEAVEKDADLSSQLLQPREFQPLPELIQRAQHSQESWRIADTMDPPGQHQSRHYRSASFSFGPSLSQSPRQHAQSNQAARLLPSPTSLNLPMPPALSTYASQPTGGPSAAQLAHLSDLQHQVSVKQLAHQTLQREYESLLQKLERQRVRSQALEKKFEVSDAEINNLNDDKERLTSQVQILEVQIEELQVARDEARKTGADSASQYMKILEMADRLQGKGVEDRKQWDKERGELLKRIANLEDHNVEKHDMELLQAAGRVKEHSAMPIDAIARPEAETSSPETSTLKQEIRHLKARIEALEKALKAALAESKQIKEAASQLASISSRLEVSTLEALEVKKPPSHAQ